MMFKFYILTNKSLGNLARLFHVLRPTDVVVVINTLDKEYEKNCSDFCQKHRIEYFVTESDGTAATGKNSVLQLFLESDNEYMVHVDGDDFITPYGRNLYRTTALSPNPPDVIAIYDQLQLDHYRRDLWSDQYDSRTVKWEGMYIPMELCPAYPHSSSRYGGYREFTVEEMARQFVVQMGLPVEKSKPWAEIRLELNRIFHRYGDREETFCRLIFFSRKAAKSMHYDKSLIIGEDTYQYYQLKKLAFDGELDMRVRREKWAFSYVYLNDTTSITKSFDPKTGKGRVTDYDWMFPLHEALNKIIPTLPVDYPLPEFRDPYYEVNKK